MGVSSTPPRPAKAPARHHTPMETRRTGTPTISAASTSSDMARICTPTFVLVTMMCRTINKENEQCDHRDLMVRHVRTPEGHTTPAERARHDLERAGPDLLGDAGEDQHPPQCERCHGDPWPLRHAPRCHPGEQGSQGRTQQDGENDRRGLGPFLRGIGQTGAMAGGACRIGRQVPVEKRRGERNTPVHECHDPTHAEGEHEPDAKNAVQRAESYARYDRCLYDERVKHRGPLTV